MSRRPSALLVAAHVEVVSLIVLLVNLGTVHAPAVSSLIGPTHGCAYLFVFGAAVRAAGSVRTRAAALAVVPGIGGLLSRHHLNHLDLNHLGHLDRLTSSAGVSQ